MRHCLLILGFITLFYSCSDVTVRKEGFAVHGIDVSHYQRKVDWEAVGAQDIHFAFIKATEGLTFRDSFFCTNWMGAKEAGVKRGAYHFFRPSVSPESQAENFIEFSELSHGDLAPVLDIEVEEGMNTEAIVRHAAVWLQIVEDHYKIKPIIYTNQKFFNRHLARHFQNYPIWIARYSSWREPCLHKGHDWLFWQYGNRGRLRGINGPVDLNVFRGSLSDLEAYCLVRPMPIFLPDPEDVAMSAP